MAVSMAGQVHTEKVHTYATTSQDWGVFFLRLVLGIIFLMHGGQKAFGWFGGHTLGDSVAMMGSMGILAPFAYLAIFTELIGGVSLILGFLTRIAAVGLFIDMIVAVALVHFKNGFFLKPDAIGDEFNFALMGMCLALILAGPGAASLVDLEGKLFKHK